MPTQLPGIQLYSLKSNMEKDPWSTLKILSEMGYALVESYEGPEGFLWGKTPEEFKKQLRDLGLSAIGAHIDVFEKFEEKLDMALIAGMPYLVCPWLGSSEDPDFYKKALERLILCGHKCKEAGIRLAYHNHDYSFRKIKDWSPISYFLEQSDPCILSFEMDVYWVIKAQESPIGWIEKYPDRWPLLHIKDRHKTMVDETCTLGQGDIEYQSLLKEIPDLENKYCIIEQEHFQGKDPLYAMKGNIEKLRTILF